MSSWLQLWCQKKSWAQQRCSRAKRSGRSCCFRGKEGAFWCASGMQELPLQYQGGGTGFPLGTRGAELCKMLRVIQCWNMQCGAYSKRSLHLPLTSMTQPGVTWQGDYFQLPELCGDTELIFRQSRLTAKIAFSWTKQPWSGYLASKRVTGPNLLV